MRVRIGCLNRGRRESSVFVDHAWSSSTREGETAVYWCLGRERGHLRRGSGWEANEIPMVSILYNFFRGALLHVIVLRRIFWGGGEVRGGWLRYIICCEGHGR